MHSKESGQTLMELIVVISVSVIVVGALVFATIASLRNASFAKNQAQATKLAQEGIERVRGGRDRNQCISIVGVDINSWNGGNDKCTGLGSIWRSISSVFQCEQEQIGVSKRCYFTVTPDGKLQSGFSYPAFPKDQAEKIPPTNTVFYRATIVSDDLNSDNIFTNDDPGNAKKVTAIVQWKDFAGDHESKLTTILRKI